jgi:hypothetical protein
MDDRLTVQLDGASGKYPIRSFSDSIDAEEFARQVSLTPAWKELTRGYRLAPAERLAIQNAVRVQVVGERTGRVVVEHPLRFR